MSEYSIRRQSRLRREYLYRKAREDQLAQTQKKKDTVTKYLKAGKEFPSHLKPEALSLMEAAEWDDEGPRFAAEIAGEDDNIDDEYRWAGVKDPRLVVTTSRDPSVRLKKFAKEFRIMLPNCTRINRGSYDMKQLMDACRKNEITDIIFLNETRGRPDTLLICHFPYGPTAYFSLQDVVMRHDVPDIDQLSQQFPHLIFNNFQTNLAERTKNILKYLFPVPKDDSKRIISFTNWDDWLLFRHHIYQKLPGKNDYKLTELGPRFSMKLIRILRGTLENIKASDIEFTVKPYKNTERKRTFFSSEEPWKE